MTDTTQSAPADAKPDLSERLRAGPIYFPDDLPHRIPEVKEGATKALMIEAADEIVSLRAEVEEGRRALIASGIVSDVLVEEAREERDTECRKRRNAEEMASIWKDRATAAEAALSTVTAERDRLREALEKEIAFQTSEAEACDRQVEFFSTRGTTDREMKARCDAARMVHRVAVERLTAALTAGQASAETDGHAIQGGDHG